MKRYVSLACIAMVLVMCLVSPVSAASSHSNLINVLDYAFPNDGSSRFVTLTSSSNSATFGLPDTLTVYYVDVLAVITGDIPSSVTCSDLSHTTRLNIDYIDGSLYRIYGNLPGAATSYLSLNFEGISGSWVTFQSFRISTIIMDLFEVPLEGVGYYPGGAFDMSKNYGDSRPTQTIVTNSDYTDREYILYLFSEDWYLYDSLEFQCYFILDSINSISCVMGNDNIPLDISYLYSDASDGSYYVTFTIDCSSLNRSSDDYPMIIISGNVIFDGVSLFSLMNSHGVVYVDEVSPLKYYFTYWFSSLYDWIVSNTNILSSNINTYLSFYFSEWFGNLRLWFNNLSASIDSYLGFYFSGWFGSLENWIITQTTTLDAAIRGDTSPGNSFQQQVNQKDQQLNDMATVMESVDQPDLNSVNVSANTYVDGTVLAASMSGITSVFSQGLFFDLIVMSIMMATAGYVLFGKR